MIVRNSKGEFLITKRHPNKKAGNLWEFTGGGTLAGESTKLSAIRELQEETGIQASSPYTRCLQTAAIVSRIRNIPLKVEVDLHEWIPDLLFQNKAGECEEIDKCRRIYPV